MSRTARMTLTLANLLATLGIAAACSSLESTQPDGATVEIVFARTPAPPLSTGDTISVIAIVRDSRGVVVDDAAVYWDLELDGNVRAGPGAGSIISTGPRTALLTVYVERVVIRASGRPDNGARTYSGQLGVDATRRTTRVFLWSRENGFSFIPSPEGASSFPHGINDAGEIVGSMSFGLNKSQTFVWSAAGGLRYLDAGAVPDGAAMPINASGSVTGMFGGLNSPQRAFVWNRNSEFTLIPALPENSRSSYAGYAINSAGAIAGNIVGDTTWNAFRWSPQEGEQRLRGSTEVPHTYAVAINDSGQVIGYDGTWELWDPVLSRANPILWSASGTWTEIVPDCRRKCVIDLAALNNRGQVAGTLNSRAFRWNASTGLASMPGAGVQWARGMNDAGDVVVAISSAPGRPWGAQLWTASGEVIDLGMPPGARYVIPRAINNEGIVVGQVF